MLSVNTPHTPVIAFVCEHVFAAVNAAASNVDVVPPPSEGAAES
jgi:hypothetical protein